MNGYELTNRLRKIRRKYPLTATEQAVYHELVAICNEVEWEDIFSVSNDELCVSLNITEKTLISSRNTLIQQGLIYYKSGKSRRTFGQYSFTKQLTTVIIPVDTSADRGVDVTADTSVDRGVDTSDYIKLKGKLKESIDVNQPMPVNILEAAEMNQFTHTKNRNTEFLHEQWKVYLLERTNDPPPKIREYAQNTPELCRYFLNWIRNKFPKNGTAKNIPAPGGKQAGNAALYNRAKELFAGGKSND